MGRACFAFKNTSSWVLLAYYCILGEDAGSFHGPGGGGMCSGRLEVPTLDWFEVSEPRAS